MTTSEANKPRPLLEAYGRAETASRRGLLIVCVGALAWGAGALISVNLHEALAGALTAFDTGLLAIVEHWFFQHLWLLLTFTPACWLFGRFLGGRLPGVVFPAAITGEALNLALPFLQDGSAFESTEDLVGWAVTLGLFLIPAAIAFARGESSFERAKAQSLTDAAARRAEYDSFVKAALGPDGVVPTGLPTSGQIPEAPSASLANAQEPAKLEATSAPLANAQEPAKSEASSASLANAQESAKSEAPSVGSLNAPESKKPS